MTPTANNRKVLVIGWDAADWRVIRPMLAEDKLPNLKAFMANRASMQCLFMDYAEIIKDSKVAAATLNAFLGGNLDESAMHTAVDPTLQRQRSGDGPS